MSSYEPTSDAELNTYVRALTGYENTEDELTDPRLDSIITVAKMRLATTADSEDFYRQDGLGQALVGVTAILAKNAVENYSVTSWDMGAGSIDVRGAGDPDQAQFTQWATLVSNGLAEHGSSSETATNINSAGYIG